MWPFKKGGGVDMFVATDLSLVFTSTELGKPGNLLDRFSTAAAKPSPRYPVLLTQELELHAATASPDGQQIAGSV